MPKLQVFLWQVRHYSLPLEENLIYRGPQMDHNCPHCDMEIENATHLLLGVKLAESIDNY